MRGITRLKRYYRKLRDYIDPKAVILMYHRVADLPSYAYSIAVTPDHFRQQLACLRQAFQPVTLQKLVEAVKRGSILRRAVVITFDDGYADNYLNALPILEELQIPATIFTSSGYVGGHREFWWDDLERIFLSTKMVPECLELCIHGQGYFWNLETMEERRSVRKEIHKLLKPLSPNEREHFLEILMSWAGLQRQGRIEHRPMTRDELKQLAASPMIEIGGHTVNHPQLAALPIELQNQEIMQDHKELEEIIGKRVKTFSYPFGDSGDFSSETVEIVQKAGYIAACSTHHTRVVRGADLYRLPRYWVGDWTAEEFQNQITGFFQK